MLILEKILKKLKKILNNSRFSSIIYNIRGKYYENEIKQLCHSLEKILPKLLLPLEAQYGVSIRLGNITYNTNDFHTRLEVKNVGTDEASSRELWIAEQKKAYWKNTLVDKVEYDKWYLGNDGRNYKVIGFNTTRPKNILRIVNGLGKEYSCPLGFLGIHN